MYVLFKNVVLLPDRSSTEKSRKSTRSLIISPCLLSLQHNVLYLTVLLSLTGTWTSFPFPRMQAQTSYLRRVLTTSTQKWSPRGLQLYCPGPKLSPCSSTQPTEPTPGTRYSPPFFPPLFLCAGCRWAGKRAHLSKTGFDLECACFLCDRHIINAYQLSCFAVRCLCHSVGFVLVWGQIVHHFVFNLHFSVSLCCVVFKCAAPV